MNPDLLTEAKMLWNTYEKMDKIQHAVGFYPPNKLPELIKGFLGLADVITPTPTPVTIDQVHNNELRRRFQSEGERLHGLSSDRQTTTDDVLEMYNIDPSDIQALKPWLIQHRPQALDFMLHLYETTDTSQDRLDIPLDIPQVQDAAIHAATRDLSNYHSKLGRLLEELSEAGGFLRDVTAVPTLLNRSYFDGRTNTLALFVGDICSYAPDRTFHTKRRELIDLYGHEGEGHALNQVITQKSGLPFIFKKDSFSTVATMEAVAQFYQLIIFEDLRGAKDVQKQLDITHIYEALYEQQKATAYVNEYQSRLYRYSVSVLADKSLGDHNDPKVMQHRAGLIEEVALYPRYGREMIENHRYKYDSEGNFDPGETAELRYIAQPVEKALAVMRQNGLTTLTDRSKVDLTLLTGFWTPTGLVEMAGLTRKI